MIKRFLSFGGAAMLAVLVLTACGGDDESDAGEDVTRVPVANAPIYASPDVAQEPVGTPAAETATGGGGGGAAVTVVAVDIAWEPEAFSVPAGTDTVVSLPNDGASPHNFAVDALGIDIDMPAGETVEATVNAAAGEYEFYCNVPGHKEAGMVGVMTVQ